MPYEVREFSQPRRFLVRKLSVPVSGRITSEGYDVMVGEREFVWPVSGTGADGLGQFVVLTPGDMFIEKDIMVRVEQELDDPPAYANTTISLLELADAIPHERALWRNKVYPESVNLLIPPQHLLCITFRHNGSVLSVNGSETPGTKPLGRLPDPAGGA